MRRWWTGAAALALLAPVVGGCHRAGPAPHPHYVLGPAWQGDVAWFYPTESYSAVQTGLAAIAPDRGGRLTADGETYRPDALAAAHQTLQLPAVVRLTNLDDGRQMLVRLNDRGPASPARLVAVTPRVATLLGLRDGTPVRLEVMAEASHQAVDAVGGGPRLAIATAPLEAITAQALPPLDGAAAGGVRAGGVRAGGAGSGAGTTVIGRPAAADAAPAADVVLPGTVTRVPVGPVRLMLRLGTFTNPGPAGVQAQHVPALSAYVVSHPSGRSTTYAVLAGPYPTARAAEAALDEALRAGVPDARIIARSDADQF